MNVSDLRDALNVAKEREYTVPLGELEYRNGAILHRDWDCQIDGQGLRKLGRYLNIPILYLEKCPPGLREANINYWLNDKPDAEARIHILDGLLTGINPREKTPLGVRDIAEAVSEALRPDDIVLGIQFDGETLVIDTSTGGTSRFIGADEVCTGVRVTAYPHAAVPPTVEPLILWDNEARIAIPSPQGVVPLRDTTNGVRDTLSNVIRAELDAATAHLEALVAANNSELNGYVEDTLDNIDRTYRLNKKVAAHLYRLGMERDPKTGYGLVLLLADAAQYPMIDRTRRHLQHIAGALLVDPNHDPRNCHHCKKRDTPNWAR